jgi:hypothetical protein
MNSELCVFPNRCFQSTMLPWTKPGTATRRTALRTILTVTCSRYVSRRGACHHVIKRQVRFSTISCDDSSPVERETHRDRCSPAVGKGSTHPAFFWVRSGLDVKSDSIPICTETAFIYPSSVSSTRGSSKVIGIPTTYRGKKACCGRIIFGGLSSHAFLWIFLYKKQPSRFYRCRVLCLFPVHCCRRENLE